MSMNTDGTEPELGLTEEDFKRMEQFAKSDDAHKRQHLLVPGLEDPDRGDGELALDDHTKALLERESAGVWGIPVPVCAMMRKLARHGETTRSLTNRRFVNTERTNTVANHVTGDCNCEHESPPVEEPGIAERPGFSYVTPDECREMRERIRTESQVDIGRDMGYSGSTVRNHAIICESGSCRHDEIEGMPDRYAYTLPEDRDRVKGRALTAAAERTADSD